MIILLSVLVTLTILITILLFLVFRTLIVIKSANDKIARMQIGYLREIAENTLMEKDQDYD